MQTQYEEINAIIALGYDHENEARRVTILSQDGIAEKYLRAHGVEQLAKECGLYDMTVDRGVERVEFKSNVYRVSATIEIIDGEFGDMSQIVIGGPLLAKSALYV